MSDGDFGSTREIPFVEPTDEQLRSTRSDSRRRGGIVVVVLICVVAAAIPVAIRMSSSHDTRRARPPRHLAKRVDPRPARVSVASAVAATLAARNYRIEGVLTETAGPGSTLQQGMTISSESVIDVDPLATVATSSLGITSWTDSTREWEQGGGSYGITPGSGIGPGAPISGFESLVSGTLGNREGGVAMMSLASPFGRLDLTTQAIETAAPAGTTTLDGSTLTEYDVTLDASRLLNLPGMSGEQIKTATGGFDLLQQSGYTGTTERVGIDAAGYVRQAHTVWTFSDGGAVTSDTTFHDYGCAGTDTLPTQAPASPPPPTCSSPDPAATTPPTTPPPSGVLSAVPITVAAG